jgi:phospholipid-binding lipoprotein MlaA
MKARSLFAASSALANGAALLRGALAVGVMLLATGCATGPNANPADPLEPLNRKTAAFNDKVDDLVLRPVATVYHRVMPTPVRNGVTNFFGNLSDVWSFVNNVAQFKLHNGFDDFVRVNINTFWGIGGVFDIATQVGLPRHSEDFGQTLGRWGVPSGPYLVLPLLGPSTFRDAAALIVDVNGDPVNYITNIPLRNSLYGLRLVDIRSNLLQVSALLDAAALDRYTFTRDAFLQRRLNDVHDGNLPDNGGGDSPPTGP